MAFNLSSSARRSRRHGRAPMAEINVTPLVDVMLVLLIIFMVTAPLLTAGVPVELPQSRANPLPQDPKQVTISLTRDGRSFIGEEEISPEALPERLAALAPTGGAKPPVITLRADTTLPYGKVMAVMGELNRANLTTISLVTSGSVTAP